MSPDPHTSRGGSHYFTVEKIGPWSRSVMVWIEELGLNTRFLAPNLSSFYFIILPLLNGRHCFFSFSSFLTTIKYLSWVRPFLMGFLRIYCVLLRTTPSDSHYYYPHFIEEEMETEKLGNLPKITELRSCEVGLEPRLLTAFCCFIFYRPSLSSRDNNRLDLTIVTCWLMLILVQISDNFDQ